MPHLRIESALVAACPTFELSRPLWRFARPSSWRGATPFGRGDLPRQREIGTASTRPRQRARARAREATEATDPTARSRDSRYSSHSATQPLSQSNLATQPLSHSATCHYVSYVNVNAPVRHRNYLGGSCTAVTAAGTVAMHCHVFHDSCEPVFLSSPAAEVDASLAFLLTERSPVAPGLSQAEAREPNP